MIGNQVRPRITPILLQVIVKYFPDYMDILKYDIFTGYRL